MSKPGPIILIEDDEDDLEIIDEIIKKLGIPNELKFFTDGKQALEFLRTTTVQPFLILSDVNMPLMSGFELRKIINDDEELRSKSVPFVFLTTSADPAAIREAYKMNVQGFFVKGSNLDGISRIMKMLYEYWQECRHPNN